MTITMAKIRENYQGLSHEELLNEAYELGSNFENYSMSCSQSTVAALHELLEIDDVVVKVASSLSGGSALQMLGTCGALAGGIIVLDYYFGRSAEKMSYRETIQANVDELLAASEAPGLLADKFVNEYGTFICAQLNRKLFGRIYWLRDPQDLEKIGEAGAHSDPAKCRRVVGNAARWVMEILIDKGSVRS